jgi:hypothetical protein
MVMTMMIPQNWIIAAIGLARVVVFAPTLLSSARTCEQRGGIWVHGQFGGWVCVKKKAVIYR